MGGALIAILALLTFHRSQAWVSDRALWEAERRTPRMTANLGAALLLEGRNLEAEQWLVYGLRLSANPNLSARDRRIGRLANLGNLAILYARQGRDIEARMIAQDVSRTMPTWPLAIRLCEVLTC